MTQGKLLFACILLWAAMAAGWFFSNHLVLIFLGGCKPIRAKKNCHFKDKMLMKRANMPPGVIRPMTQRSAKVNAAKEIARSQNGQAAKWLQ